MSGDHWTKSSPLLIKNKPVIIAVLFMIVTLVSSTIGLLRNGSSSTTDDIHIWARFAFTAIPITSLYLFDFLQSWSFIVVHVVHYVATVAAVMLFVFISGLFVELHPSAYRDGFLNFTIVYIGVTIFEFAVVLYRKKFVARNSNESVII
ncbi:hypothetical protein P9112_002318 [Eukaryota sp. TZLM1-RC]